MVQEGIQFAEPFGGLTKFLPNWCSMHFFSWQVLIKKLHGHLFLTVNWIRITVPS